MLPFIREHFSEPVVKLSQWRYIEYPTAIQPKNLHIKCPTAKSHGKTYSKICVCFSVVSALQQILRESPLGLLGSLNQWLYSSNFQGYSHSAFRLFPFSRSSYSLPPALLFSFCLEIIGNASEVCFIEHPSLSLSLMCCNGDGGLGEKTEREILVSRL